MIHPDPRRSRDWQMQCILEGAHGRENGRMRVLGLAVMCLVAFGVIPARALTGNDLYGWCRSKVDYEMARCIGYMEGTLDMDTHPCTDCFGVVQVTK